MAVLYFDNLSRDSADAYLADGLTEQTIAQLGEVERLTVASRFAVRRFRGGEAGDPAAVGRALNVSYLVTGSVQRSGSRLRVGVELVRASSGVRVWGERYDRTETDLLRLQDDIASAVAGGIVGRLLPEERRGLTTRGTRDPVAWDRFLRGNYLVARREPGAMALALREYQAAIAADAAFTDAVARLAYAYGLSLENEYDLGLPRDTMVARGVAMAERALHLDTMSSNAWMAAAYIRMAERPLTLDGVRPRFERAIALDPRNAEAHHQFGSYLSYMGDTAMAARMTRRALELEPGRGISWVQLSDWALRDGRYRDAQAFLDSALTVDPEFILAHIYRVLASHGLRDSVTARGSIRILLVNPASHLLGRLMEAFLTEAMRPDSGSTGRIMAAFPPGPPSPTTPGTSISGGYVGVLFAQVGGYEAALVSLEQARPRGARLHDIMRYRFLDPIRQHPGFQVVWRESTPPGVTW